MIYRVFLMILKLKDIANIHSGITVRSRIESLENGKFKVVQMKDLGNDNVIDLSNCYSIDVKRPKNTQLLKSNDLVFRSRGYNNESAFMTESVKNVLLGPHLFLIRVYNKKVLPKYLFWYMNNKSSQNYLSSFARGSMIQMVNKSTLEDMPIKVPSLEKQKEISEFYDLASKEKSLRNKVESLKDAYYESILLDLLSK